MPKKNQLFFEKIYNRLYELIKQYREQEQNIKNTAQIMKAETDEGCYEIDNREWAQIATEVKSPVKGLEMAIAEIQAIAKEMNLI